MATSCLFDSGQGHHPFHHPIAPSSQHDSAEKRQCSAVRLVDALARTRSPPADAALSNSQASASLFFAARGTPDFLFAPSKTRERSAARRILNSTPGEAWLHLGDRCTRPAALHPTGAITGRVHLRHLSAPAGRTVFVPPGPISGCAARWGGHEPRQQAAASCPADMTSHDNALKQTERRAV